MTLKKSLLRLAAAAAGALLLSAPASAQLFSSSPTDLAAEATLAARQGKQLAVLFEMDDCPSCAKLKKTVFSDKATRQLFERGFRSVSVNISRNAEVVLPDGRRQTPAAWAERLHIAAAPAIAFFDGKGQILYRHVGPVADSQELLALGRYVETAEYERRPFVSYLSAQKPGKGASLEFKGEICRTRS